MATVFADRSYRASLKAKKKRWSVQSMPLLILGVLLALLSLASACVDILPAIGVNVIPVSSSQLWGSSGVWIFAAVCLAFVALVFIDLSKPRKV